MPNNYNGMRENLRVTFLGWSEAAFKIEDTQALGEMVGSTANYS